MRARLPKNLKLWVLAALLGCFWKVHAAPEVGDVAPSLKLQTAQGQFVELRKFAKTQGKRNLLLLFYRTGNCSICVGQLQELSEHLGDFHLANAAVVAVSLDDGIVQAETRDKLSGGKFPLLLDPDAKLTKRFGVYNPKEKMARPAQFLMGPDFKVLHKYVGRASGDRPAWDKLLKIVQHYSGLLPTRDAAGDQADPSR